MPFRYSKRPSNATSTPENFDLQNIYLTSSFPFNSHISTDIPAVTPPSSTSSEDGVTTDNEAERKRKCEEEFAATGRGPRAKKARNASTKDSAEISWCKKLSPYRATRVIAFDTNAIVNSPEPSLPATFGNVNKFTPTTSTDTATSSHTPCCCADRVSK